MEKITGLKIEAKEKVEFNHLIILAKEKKNTADFITWLLDLPSAVSADGAVPDFFLCIPFDNEVMILVAEYKDHPIGHCAFKVTGSHFKRILAKLKSSNRDFWADPKRQRPFEYYELEGNRGLYVIDPSGHALEVLTKIDA